MGQQMMGRHRTRQRPIFDGSLQARAERLHERYTPRLVTPMRGPFLARREPLSEVVQKHGEARAGRESERRRLT